jgi:hypothetical protein
VQYLAEKLDVDGVVRRARLAQFAQASKAQCQGLALRLLRLIGWTKKNKKTEDQR